jgi:hypothetical protein
MLVVLVVAVGGIALGVGLARLLLSGLLAVTFKRARSAIRRMVERRRTPRPDAVDRRADERRGD